MTQVTLEPALRSQLVSLESEAELRDLEGALVGYFVPPALHRELLLAWSRTNVSDDALESSRRQPGGRLLSEILSDLERS